MIYFFVLMFVLILELARIRNAKGVGSTPLSKDTAGRILHEAGMLKKSTSVEGWLIRMPRLRHLKHARPRAYTLLFTRYLKRKPEKNKKTRKYENC